MTDRRSVLRVLVVEGQPLYRDLLVGLIDSQADMRVVGASGTAAAALSAADCRIDVVVIGPRLPDGGDALSLGHAMRLRAPRIGVVAILPPRNARHVAELTGPQSVGWGVLLKSMSLTASLLVSALRAVSEGRSFLDPAIRQELDARRESAVSRLSARQREVLGLVAEGFSNAAIARRLALSPRSVEAHLRASYAVLGLGSDPERNARVDAARSFLAHVAQYGPRPAGESPLI